MMDQIRSMLSDPAVQVYFLVLGIVIRRCVKQYYRPSSPTAKTSTHQSKKKQALSAPSLLPILLSVAVIGITWFLILRSILTNLHTSESYFDDAYKDVLRTEGHYFTSTQLLFWAIVAVAWTADAGSDLAFLLFGFLGAMAASFVLWVPTLYRRGVASRKKVLVSGGGCGRRTIPVSYVLSSIIAFVSILKLQPCDPSTGECTPDQGFGSFHLHFRQWLQTLHIILVAPVLASPFLPNNPRIDSSALFGLLFATISAWHILQMTSGAAYTMPKTDCQMSIATDLVCCSFITLYVIYMDALQTRNGVDNGAAAALLRLSAAAALMPLLSPAAVLAGHLCLQRLHDSHATLVSCMQRYVASQLRDEAGASGAGATANWCNLGLWTETKGGNICSYNCACENLAQALGKAAGLGPSDAVLSCGCGSVDEVRFFRRRFHVRHITGIDPQLIEPRTIDTDDFNVRTIRASVDHLATDNGEQPMFPSRYFDKILALDNIYHFPWKFSFLRNCFSMLPAGGRIAVSDIVLKASSRHTPYWVKVALRVTGIPAENLWSSNEYRKKFATLGYDGVNIQLIGDAVFKGWSRFLPKALLDHIDYAIIVASKPSTCPPRPKKKVAIIGSGLAGLSAAHYILTSPEAADFVVDVYEASDCPGLAGNTTLIGEQLVDVPARMAALGYYNRYREILDELDIPTTVVRTDSSFYGKDGNGGEVCHSYDNSSLVNIYNALFVGGLRRLWQLIAALSSLRDDSGGIQTDVVHLTFGEWLQKHLSVPSATSFTCKDTGVDKKHDLPSLTCYENPFAYIMVGSLSWMLSCTWEQLAKYPADIVLPYCQGLNMSRLGIGRKGQVIRVSPSIKVLERALLYGVNELQCGLRVAAVDGKKKLVNGRQYDAVVCATEAKAVQKVIKNCSDVFGKIAYHPSTIYLHKDESFMPPNKKDWKCWNVEMSSGRQEPQLTFWLNAFYPDSCFDTNVFQTWAPMHMPKTDLTIRRSDFERVVHSQHTKKYVEDIEKEQGKNGIYYAGSYAVYGMGLLEQALTSGKAVSERLVKDFCTGPGNAAAPSDHNKAPPLDALVVGAGPSGLVAAKYLASSNTPIYNVTLLESSTEIGGTFHNKVYDDTRLVSSKYITAFSDFRMDFRMDDEVDLKTMECPNHPSATQYVDYLKRYAQRFDLERMIQFGSTVVHIGDAPKSTDEDKGVSCTECDTSGYMVRYRDQDNQIITKHYDVIAVCSGLHNTGFVPAEFCSSSSLVTKFKGQVIHSSQYKTPTIFTNKRVLILGSGETALDIAYRAIHNPHSQSVALNVRRGFLSIPHNLAEDRPLDVFITNLFEHAYEHPWVHALRLRWVLSTVFIRAFLLLTGSSVGFNQWACHTTPIRRGYHIINKSHAAMSHLNVAVKSRSLLGRFWMWVYGESNLRPIESYHRTQVTEVENDGVTVRFDDGRTYEADLIVLATGYKQSFPFLDDAIRQEFRAERTKQMVAKGEDSKPCCSNIDPSVDKNTCADSYTLEEDYLPSQHFITSTRRPRLGFIGFVRPNVGAIPPMAEMQVMWWLERMQNRINWLLRRSEPPSYMVLGAKYQYGVDYGNYMHRVAEDIDAAPTLTTLARSSQPLKALYTYCLGQSHVPLFRLQGRYASKICWEVVTGELWHACLKRGWAENVGLLYMTWLSLLMNLAACVLESLWCLVTLRRPQFFIRY